MSDSRLLHTVSETQKDLMTWVCSEETHLARALFRRGADEVRHCSFSEGFINPPIFEGFLLSPFNEATPEDLCSNVDGTAQTAVKLSLYSPLQGNTIIRLLVLNPGSLGSPLECAFLYCDLVSRNLPTYEAISYAWGDPSDTREVSCNGHTLRITQSLHGVFERIRCLDRVRYVWADALCINQKDTRELGQQVSIMQDIYRSANRVLVWLGNDVQGKAHEAFALCCTIVEHWRIPPNKPIVDGFLEYQDMISTAVEGELDPFPLVSAEVWDSLTKLFNLPWFR